MGDLPRPARQRPDQAAALLADAVAVLESRARQLAADGSGFGSPPRPRPR